MSETQDEVQETAPGAGKKDVVRPLAVVIAALAVMSTAALTASLSPGKKSVVETYKKDAKAAQLPVAKLAPKALSDTMRRDALMLANILGEVDALERQMREMNRKFQVSQNANKGLYTVAQERAIARAYSRYLVLRKALFHVAFRYRDYAKITDQAEQDQAFLLAYASGLTLYRNAVVFVMLFKDQPNARKKLNEADPVLGIPANTLDELYANITAPANVRLVIRGVDSFRARRKRLEGARLVTAPEQSGLTDILARLDRYEGELERAYRKLGEGKRDMLWTRVSSTVKGKKYAAQSFISSMVGHLRVPLHAKGLTPESVQRDLRPLLKPGDILLTRRDGYLSNTFLPGFWGHAALYVGRPEEVKALGTDPALARALKSFHAPDGEDQDGRPFAVVEAIGEGVRFSSLEFAAHADLITVLRPKVEPAHVRAAIARAIALRGTPYDFAFDLSTQDKIICTELVYRAYSPHLETRFEEVMGTKTLKPDGLLRYLNPTAKDAPASFVLYGNAVDGVLKTSTAEALMKTVLRETP